MAGLLLIAIFIGYLFLAFYLFNKCKTVWKKITLISILILIPTADEFYYAHKLNNYCENEAGFKIYKHVSRKEGLVDRLAYFPEYLNTKLVGYVERYDEISKETYRFERQADGSIKKKNIGHLTAPYQFVRNQKKSGTFIESELQVLDRNTGEVVGELKDLNFYGGWFRHGLLGSLSDSGGTLISDCGINESSRGKNELINKVFSENNT